MEFLTSRLCGNQWSMAKVRDVTPAITSWCYIIEDSVSLIDRFETRLDSLFFSLSLSLDKSAVMDSSIGGRWILPTTGGAGSWLFPILASDETLAPVNTCMQPGETQKQRTDLVVTYFSAEKITVRHYNVLFKMHIKSEESTIRIHMLFIDSWSCSVLCHWQRTWMSDCDFEFGFIFVNFYRFSLCVFWSTVASVMFCFIYQHD